MSVGFDQCFVLLDHLRSDARPGKLSLHPLAAALTHLSQRHTLRLLNRADEGRGVVVYPQAAVKLCHAGPGRPLARDYRHSASERFSDNIAEVFGKRRHDAKVGVGKLLLLGLAVNSAVKSNAFAEIQFGRQRFQMRLVISFAFAAYRQRCAICDRSQGLKKILDSFDGMKPAQIEQAQTRKLSSVRCR